MNLKARETNRLMQTKRALAKKYHNLTTLAGSKYKKQKFTTKARKYENEANVLEHP